MTTKPSVNTFTCKKLFTTPCKSFIHLFKSKKVLIRRNHSRKIKPAKVSTKTRRFCCLMSFCRSSRPTEDMDRVMELKSFSDARYMQKAPCPSPLTPAYIKMGRAAMLKDDNDVENKSDVEDGCRRFESYLVEMITEEGKMRDLVDVEELLYSWRNLKSPVFINMVSRFYGELCKDLFSSNVDNNGDDDIRNLV